MLIDGRRAVHVLGWPPARRREKEEVLGILRPYPTCVVHERSEQPSVRTAFHLPGVPALAFLDDYSRLPVHTAQDTIAPVRPDAIRRLGRGGRPEQPLVVVS
jgi:hypothetical protein